jgi:DNA-binding NtrC family response regulator
MSSTILIADSPSNMAEEYKNFLTGKGHKVFVAETLEEMASLFDRTPFSMALISSALVEDPDSPFLRLIKREHVDCKFVLISEEFNAEIFIKTMHCSVFHECLVAPLDFSLLEKVVQSLTRPEKEQYEYF